MRATELVLLGTFAVWLAWEILLVWGRARGKPWATISMVGTRWAVRVNSIPLLWGILAGHVFWAWPVDSAPWFDGWWVWVAVLGVVIGLDVWRFGDPPEKRPWWRRPGLWLLAGVVLGHFTWAQRG